MSSAGRRERQFQTDDYAGDTAHGSLKNGIYVVPSKTVPSYGGKQITVSESHPYDRQNGHYDGGGPFYTSRISRFVKPGYVKKAYTDAGGYSGPITGRTLLTTAEASALSQASFSNLSFGSEGVADASKDGATAIALCNPVNPVSDLGTTMAETFREGIPSLPGIQSWKHRTGILKDAGSEYLNYQFGWAPLHKEVSSVVDAARTHRSAMQQYQAGEGKNTRRSFTFPSQRNEIRLPDTAENPDSNGLGTSWFADPVARRQVSMVTETKKWFDGCFTYALPSQNDNWGRMLGYGTEADHLFGLRLDPEILWELTPWSWAVDWFSDAGFVIQNISNFGLAGLVMRYGFLMEETTIKVTIEGGPAHYFHHDWDLSPGEQKYVPAESSPWSAGYSIVTKRRVAANPFGFGVGWEGLSPTQIAITAALGITRLL